MILLVKETICKTLQKIGLIQDWVVDYGTSGIWTYRKWNSGIAECWTQLERDGTLYPGGQEGYVYWQRSGTVNFPQGLFINPPCANVWVGNGQSYLAWTSIRTLTKDEIAFYYVFDVNVGYTPYYTISAKGYWKSLS